MKYWEIVANQLTEAGMTWGCSSVARGNGQIMFVADAYCRDGGHFIVHADEKLTAFLELQRAVKAKKLR